MPSAYAGLAERVTNLARESGLVSASLVSFAEITSFVANGEEDGAGEECADGTRYCSDRDEHDAPHDASAGAEGRHRSGHPTNQRERKPEAIGERAHRDSVGVASGPKGDTTVTIRLRIVRPRLRPEGRV
jgi:hypothetical protein